VLRTERVSLPAWRSLRASPQRYDLLAISLWDMPAWMRRRALTSSVLEQALGRLSPDGVMVVLLPREPGVAVEVSSLLRGDSRRRERYVGWTCLPIGSRDCLAVFCGFGRGCRENARNWSAFELATVDDGMPPAEWAAIQPAAPAPHGSGDEVAVAARR
jgi:hypothetical protein